ncbi:MAG: hypothetical protein MOB07_26840 [Acidobacteria bacterium]|nr:hypothetical protein [Acidobacteriota bacterium]
MPDNEQIHAPGDKLFINGINGETGNYFDEPMPLDDLKDILANQELDKSSLNILRSSHRKLTEKHLGLPFGVDPDKVEKAGWAVVFHEKEDQTVKDALEALIEHRRTRIKKLNGGNDKIVKVLEYRDGETMPQWLARHGVGAGTVKPEKVPYYLLLVGSPQRIPFLFGHLLDVEYAVGRLHFDTAGEYEAYAKSLIDYESSQNVPNGKEVTFFGPSHINDPATQLSASELVKPLASGQGGQPGIVERVASASGIAYQSRLINPADSTRARLQNIFCPDAGKPAPALLFTASHGLGWPKGHAKQAGAQGALLCGDFPGPGLATMKPEHYFSGDDLPGDARVHGMVCFHFACFGVGTPAEDRFTHKQGVPPKQIAPQPFFSRLPQSLLSHKNGGALAVIGHVERAWAYSIVTEGAGPQLQPFENTIGYILDGKPLGFALKDFNERYATLSTSLGSVLEKLGFGFNVPAGELARLWVERNDAEAYVIFGDPAVSVRKDVLQ